MGNDTGFGIFAVLFTAVCVGIYMFPTILANLRGHRNFGSIAATNVLLGWTFVGWAVCFAWALSQNAKASEQDRGTAEAKQKAARATQEVA